MENNQQPCPVGEKVKCVVVLLIAALAFAWLGMPKYELITSATGNNTIIVVRYNKITGQTQRMEGCRLSVEDEEEYDILDKRGDMTDSEWERYQQLDVRRKSPCWVDTTSDSGKDTPPKVVESK